MSSTKKMPSQSPIPQELSFFVLATCASVSAFAADVGALPVESTSPHIARSAGAENLARPEIDLLPGARWDGFSLGGGWGYSTGKTIWSDPRDYYKAAGDVPVNGYNDGLLAGVQAGYHRQFGAMVVGVEADLKAGKLIGYATCGSVAGVGGSGNTCGSQTSALASVAGRVGYAIGDTLFFVKGGGAYTRSKMSASNYFYDVITPASNAAGRYGWVAGIGVAYAIDDQWSVRAEYDYYHFGKQTYALNTGEQSGSFNVAQIQKVATVGFNYRMGGKTRNADFVGQTGSEWLASHGLSGEFGTRLGFSSGRVDKKLYDGEGQGNLLSQLTWHRQSGVATEAFARLNYSSGWFVKGTFGGINISSKKMNDEDTDAAMTPYPYSNTISDTGNGRNNYGTLDVGRTFIANENGNLGAFAGYGYYSQVLNAYGCSQTAGSVLCTEGQVPRAALGLSQTENWKMVRLGLVGRARLGERLTLLGEAAWFPYAKLTAKDNHWLRPDINPLIEKARDIRGYQLESTLSYAIDRNWSLGAGGRYIYLESNGSVQFPFPGDPLQPEKFATSRWVGFLQVAYRFGF